MRLTDITGRIKFGQDIVIKDRSGVVIFHGTLMEYFDSDWIYKTYANCEVSDVGARKDTLVITIDTKKNK